jgi:hypothetical protein
MFGELHVKKQPVPVTLHMSDGTSLSGTIFLSPVGPTQAGRETVGEMMSEPESLFPFRSQSERFLMIGKEATSAIRVVSGEVPPVFGGRIPVEAVLVGGHRFSGSLLTEDPDDRLSGEVNRPERWLRMETTSGIVWLRRASIIHLAQLNA